MSYLSMRMREEGFWGRPKVSEVPPLTVTISVDVSRAVDQLEQIAAAFGWRLDPWQRQVLEGLEEVDETQFGVGIASLRQACRERRDFRPAGSEVRGE